MVEAQPKFALPGDQVGLVKEFKVGKGCYAVDDIIRASVAGRVTVRTATLPENSSGSALEAELPEMSVLKSGSLVQEVIPKVGDVVTCRVTKITTRIANVIILGVGDKPVVGSGFRATIRKENVRLTEVDKVVLPESFRPGDIVRAGVAALGSARSFELSTAQPEFGVIDARCSVSKEPMVPINWQEMRCPVTRMVEKRKVAKQV
eukprot:CAMPEP_0184015194 /NCGR_PEP_ID=MMETSP0954-20121128/6155_1 /TAXON_ID=627963 /ORGANISM="Aplanochytrium sp, Strain PBS07" /LENGTH=204 /DNA_ID=CAMNT_0026295911 /DNA_START=1385 /DNA_END=1999 /DNA_ORIENTATION=-